MSTVEKGATDAPQAPPQPIIKSADMSEEMQKVAIEVATEAMTAHDIEKDIAAYIKRDFDKRFGPTWHVVVGKNFGRYVISRSSLDPGYCTHETNHFLYWYMGNIAITG
ncbi:SPOSA6832_02889, partial [Sporobolomyces salmonicolor]